MQLQLWSRAEGASAQRGLRRQWVKAHVTPVTLPPRQRARVWSCGHGVYSHPESPGQSCPAAFPRLGHGRLFHGRTGHICHQRGSSSEGRVWQTPFATWPLWERGLHRFSSGSDLDYWALLLLQHSRQSSPRYLLLPRGPCRNSGSLQAHRSNE